MVTDHREIAFEKAIEADLLATGEYTKGDPASFDRQLALHPDILLTFIKKSQPKAWERLEVVHGSQVEQKVLHRLHQVLDQRGMLHVLRKGIEDYGVHLQLMFPKPASRLNPDAWEQYNQNILTITRQVKYSMKNENSIDVLISINGLPVITMELKNPLTGQNVEHAKRQYAEDRDPKELIFQFKKRVLVHFAVDPDEVYMTTKLEGHKTFFLPFNRGYNRGAGNPPNEYGFKTSYLWNGILRKDSLIDLLSRFIHLEVKEKKKKGRLIKKETMIFPRFHQLDVVRKLEADIIEKGVGQNYLIQHSAGSGKSNSIAWLAHRLSNLHNNADELIFDSIIIISDRRVLDKQLQDTIYQFDHKPGVVERIDKDSNQLAEALRTGKKIIITTLQKFPFILDKVESLRGQKFAVIVDEAHSSQTGESAQSLKKVLSLNNLEEAAKAEQDDLDDAEEELIKAMQASGRQPNLSFFAFTATPKHKTLEMFGTPNPENENKPEPFHLYSMRQAIEEGFILDVLQNYMTYKTFFKINRAVEEDPRVDKKKASRAIARFVSLHPHNVSQKSEVIVEHFRRMTRHKIGGKAKAMLVTASRLHAVRYVKAIKKYIEEKGYDDIRVLVAFPGTVKDDGEEFTESGMNKFPESELPEKFGSDEYQLLIVADKYQTGFDQPLLHTMYVDKKLHGVKAVQTLSRLNRTCPGKEDTFVLDFVNEPEEIQAAFQPYYEKTVVDEVTDPNMLYDFRNQIEDFQFIYHGEIEAFCKTYFKPGFKQDSRKDLAKLYAYLNPAVDRFKQATPDQQESFRDILNKYVRLYAFLSQIMPFKDRVLHKLYVYGKFLSKILPRPKDRDAFVLKGEVSLEYYRLQQMTSGSISLVKEQDGEVRGFGNKPGVPSASEKAALSEIIQKINERFGTDFTEADRLFYEQWKEDLVADEQLVQHAKNNSLDNYQFAFEPISIKKLIDRRSRNDEFFKRIMSDPEFKKFVLREMMVEVYREQREAN